MALVGLPAGPSRCLQCGFISSPVGQFQDIVQELCENRGGRPGLSVLTSLLVSVDVKLYIEPCFGIGLRLVPNMSTDI